MKATLRSLSKLIIFTFISVVSFGSYASLHDHTEGLTCANKARHIESQIEQAREYNKKFRIKGLEKALQKVKNNCNDKELEAKYKEDIADKTDKLTERKRELAVAQIRGDKEKITMQKLKLSDAIVELTEANTRLTEFYNQLIVK